MVVDFDFEDEEKRPAIQDLLFDMTDKSEDELWAIVADACRSSSKDWRAYEKLHGKFTHLKGQEKAYSDLYAKHYGSEE